MDNKKNYCIMYIEEQTKKPGTKNSWKTVSGTWELLDETQYKNLTDKDTLTFYRRDGYSETATESATPKGYKITQLNSINPNRNRKIIRRFRFDQHHITIKMASWELSRMPFNEFLNSHGVYNNCSCLVDEEIYNYFFEVMPPIQNRNYFLVGEASTHDNRGLAYYDAFSYDKYTKEYWYHGQRSIHWLAYVASLSF